MTNQWRLGGVFSSGEAINSQFLFITSDNIFDNI